MKTAFLIVVTALSFLLAAFSFGFGVLSLLIAVRVHETGLFHGIRFEIKQSLTHAGEAFLLAIPLLWSGVRLSRGWPMSYPSQSNL